MLVGYARVSTQEQDLALQLDALRAAGCDKVYEEKASGAQREGPELKAALDCMRQASGCGSRAITCGSSEQSAELPPVLDDV